MTLSNGSTPSPRAFVQSIFRLPLYIYRLGWGRMMNWLPLLILTTKGRESGEARHTVIEYRRHGSRYYVISGWGEHADWFQNALKHPRVTIQRGAQIYDATAQPVSNPAEALGALYMFSRNSWIYERLFARMSSAHAADLNTLAEVVGEFTVVRLEPSANSPELPPIPPFSQPVRQLAMVFVLLIGLRLLLSLLRRKESQAGACAQ